jgi:hypothetical protein
MPGERRGAATGSRLMPHAAGCRQECVHARDNRAHDEELIPRALNKRLALNEWRLLTGLR